MIALGMMCLGAGLLLVVPTSLGLGALDLFLRCSDIDPYTSRLKRIARRVGQGTAP